MFAATWPTSCRSTPVTVMCVCFSIATSMPRRDVEDDRVRVAEREDHLLALDLRAVADADDVELLLEAVGDARAPRWRSGCAPGRGTLPSAGSSVAASPSSVAVGELAKLMPAGNALAQLAFRAPALRRAPSTHLDGDALWES